MNFSRVAILMAAVAAAPGPLRADCPGARAGRVALIAGTYVGAEATAIGLRHQDWWMPPRRSFHFIWGGSPSRGQDGLLHASIAYQASQLAGLAWQWACVSGSTAGWLGAALGFAVGVPKEIGDGMYNGFSGPDMLWTAAGALLPALHQQWPGTKAVALKVFYWPSAEYRERTGPLPELENDYAGQRFYLSINPGRGTGQTSWPRWLGLAIGHGVPTWISQPPVDEWYLALDFEARGLPIRGKTWKKVAALMDQGHLPMPGVRIRRAGLAVGFF